MQLGSKRILTPDVEAESRRPMLYDRQRGLGLALDDCAEEETRGFPTAVGLAGARNHLDLEFAWAAA